MLKLYKISFCFKNNLFCAINILLTNKFLSIYLYLEYFSVSLNQCWSEVFLKPKWVSIMCHLLTQNQELVLLLYLIVYMYVYLLFITRISFNNFIYIHNPNVEKILFVLRQLYFKLFFIKKSDLVTWVIFFFFIWVIKLNKLSAIVLLIYF